jgi:CarD family transcriptional regulator
MFNIDDIVVHKRDICRITEIVKNFRPGEDYYTLIPVEDSSLVIHTPLSDKRGLIRSVISKSDAEALIQKIPSIELIEIDDDKARDNMFEKLINTGKHEDLIKVIKTIMIRKEEKEISGKKVGEKDKTYFNVAEKMLYTEFSISLGKPYQETRD